MLAYLILETQNDTLTKGRLFYKHNTQAMLLATPTQGQMFWLNSSFDKLLKEGKVQEVNLLDQRWIHPHLYAPIKKEVENLLLKNVVE